MIEQHLDDIEKEFDKRHWRLRPQQRAIIRREMAAYAQDAIHDSAVALESENICGQYADVDDDLLRRLDEAGSTGLDLSPGDQLVAEAAAEIRRLSGK